NRLRWASHGRSTTRRSRRRSKCSCAGNNLLPERSFERIAKEFDRSLLLVASFAQNNSLMQLHDWLALTLFGRQFDQGLGNFISHALDHVDFFARPSSAIIALLKDNTTVNCLRTPQGNAQQGANPNQLQLFLNWRSVCTLLTFKED